MAAAERSHICPKKNILKNITNNIIIKNVNVKRVQV
jgi:hypothetical protein